MRKKLEMMIRHHPRKMIAQSNKNIFMFSWSKTIIDKWKNLYFAFIVFFSSRERSNSVESISYEDDVVEISADENSNEKQDMEEECGIESSMQVSFLGTLGLITTTMSIELQSRKAERKRRRTANHQFVYSNWELSTVMNIYPRLCKEIIALEYCSEKPFSLMQRFSTQIPSFSLCLQKYSF